MIALFIILIALGGFMFAVNVAASIIDFSDGESGRGSVHLLNATVFVFAILVAALALAGGASC